MFIVTKSYYFVLLVIITFFIGCSGDATSKNPEVKQSTDLSNGTDVSGENSVQNQDSAKSEKPEQKAEDTSAIKVSFVELGSVNCIPCRMMQPVMKEIEEEYSDQVKVIFYDVWTPEGNPYAKKHNIRVIPTQVFLDKEGKEYFRHEGFFPKDELVEVLKKGGVK